MKMGSQSLEEFNYLLTFSSSFLFFFISIQIYLFFYSSNFLCMANLPASLPSLQTKSLSILAVDWTRLNFLFWNISISFSSCYSCLARSFLRFITTCKSFRLFSIKAQFYFLSNRLSCLKAYAFYFYSFYFSPQLLLICFSSPLYSSSIFELGTALNLYWLYLSLSASYFKPCFARDILPYMLMSLPCEREENCFSNCSRLPYLDSRQNLDWWLLRSGCLSNCSPQFLSWNTQILASELVAVHDPSRLYNQAQVCLLLQLINGMVKIVQNYTLHEQIGQGEYGKVYKGIDNRTNKDVAVKVINVKKFKENPKLEECTLNEIDVLSKIDSPHIVKFIEILKTVNNFYFFYEYCNSGTLQQDIKHYGVLQESQVLVYLQQILEAFKILSSKNIMHRDLKPSNILLHNGIIKIGDFGFCKSLQNHRDLAQTMLGSPIYMAPEVLKGEIYTIKADIWSLGVVTYEMIYGFCPFQESSIARLINVLDCKDVHFDESINRISPQLEELVRKMLAKDHFKRISWDEVLAYKISGGKIYKSSISDKYSYYQNSNQRRPLGERTNKQQSLLLKQFSEKQKQGTPKQMMFKKKPQAYARPRQFSLVQTHHAPQPSVQQGITHQKLVHFIRLVHEFIVENKCPQLTCQLAVKFYQIILKEHSKLSSSRDYSRERAEINETLHLFKQLDQAGSQASSGPMLSRYIKYMQNSPQKRHQSNYISRKNIQKWLSLLDFNQISCLRSIPDYSNTEMEKLNHQFGQKLIRNLI